VVVIGAGFAGLACGYELLAAGCEVTILEARGRVGGRVLSFQDLVPGKTVEGGGELIGSNHPVWVAYADRFGLEFLDVTEEEDLDAPIVLDGRRLTAAEALSLYEEMEIAVRAMTTDAQGVDALEPWASEAAVALDRRSTSQWLAGLPLSPLGRRGMDAQLTADNGVAIARQSYLGNLAQVKGGGLERYWTESEVYRCRGGNQQLASKLVEAIGMERIVLGTPVAAIGLEPGAAYVHGEAGRTWRADQVVLAIPPSTWHRIAVDPPLPLQTPPQMGVNVKYLAAVRGRFWRAAGLAPDAFTDGDVSMTWDGTDNQPGEQGAALVAFSGGPAAERCRARAPEEREAAYGEALGALYPGFLENRVGARFMDWPGTPWTEGGYSFPAPGEVTAIGPLLGAGLPRLQFAGEHACYRFVGYMEGALSSGVDAARRILRAAAHAGVR
jgi:monoamine oxidase